MAPSFGMPFIRLIWQRAAVANLPGLPVSMVAAFDLNDILFKWQCRRLEKLPLPLAMAMGQGRHPRL